MSEEAIQVQRLPIRLKPDPRRTITRFFWPGPERAERIISRIKELSSERISEILNSILKQFQPVNPGLEEILMDNSERAIEQAGLAYEKDFEVRMLVGAYFSMEYAFESAALFNPSMVPATDQSGLPEGSLRFIMSLRAVGEGHISSIVFRRGTIDAEGDISINPSTLQVRTFKKQENRKFRKSNFRGNIEEMSAWDTLADAILSDLPDPFTYLMLVQKIEYYEHKWEDEEAFERISKLILWMAESEYEIRAEGSFNVEDMVLFPMIQSESKGMEDMRLVLFEDDDDGQKYYGTYTAYDGHQIMPQILEVPEPGRATVSMMRGKFARNKGMALFPRRIDGRYAMIGRIDGENLFLLKSDSVDYWDDAVQMIEPKYDWEFVQIGNCGSPILTDAGWLLLTHGVGAMRKYCIGAVLLDLKDPSKVIGRLQGPLMSPAEDERSGYVPNVVYSCGGLIHQDMLVIPYGISDAASGFAIVSLPELLGRFS
ncbi:MAG: glycosidase [Woeseiaceae bacterium]|nr:glycosidase [Woeseiaceae bacterium]